MAEAEFEPSNISEVENVASYAHAIRVFDPIEAEANVFPDPISFPSVNEASASQFLSAHAWPNGLQEFFVKSCRSIPIRFVILDDSGSMSTGDGRRLVVEGDKQCIVKCSRWAEVTEAFRFHANLAEAARAPTEFRLLNTSTPVMVGLGEDGGEGLTKVLNLLDQSPCGSTPLCFHINLVVEQIRLLAPQLRANCQKAVVIIATDGLASDGDISSAMKPLQYLPVWVVVRLCTNEEHVCDYWNNIDSQLEVDMDVLDDFESEAREIAKVNNWFTYGEPLHRLREFGIVMKDMDLIDEAELTADQMRGVLTMLTVGGKPSDIVHPDVEWLGFLACVKRICSNTPLTWCPIEKTASSWIRTAPLIRRYGRGRGGGGGGGLCTVM